MVLNLLRVLLTLFATLYRKSGNQVSKLNTFSIESTEAEVLSHSTLKAAQLARNSQANFFFYRSSPSPV